MPTTTPTPPPVITIYQPVPTRLMNRDTFNQHIDSFMASLPGFGANLQELGQSAYTNAQATAADRQAVAADKSAVELLKQAAETAAQATASDRQAVATDKSAVALLKQAAETAAQATASDRQAVADDKSAVALLKQAAETAAQATASDRQTVATDKSAVELLKQAAQEAALATASDRQTVADDKSTVSGLRANVLQMHSTVGQLADQVTNDRVITGQNALATNADRQSVLDDKLAVQAILQTITEMISSGIPVDGLVQNPTHRFVTDAEKETWNNKASTVSPGFTGSPTAPTPDTSDSSGRLATTQFVQQIIHAAITQLVGAAPETMNQISELAAALGNDPNFVTTVMSAIGAKVSGNTAITPGTAPVISYDAKGLVIGSRALTAADLPAQVVLTSDSRLSDPRPASDVYSWAKGATKPVYSYSEVGAPSASGAGAGGTWPINITGRAASADSAPASDVYPWAKQPTKPSYTLSELGAQKAVTISTAAASGGVNGDVWFQYTP